MSQTEIQKDATFPRSPFTTPKRDVDFLADSASTVSGRRRRPDYRSRYHAAPVLVEATVHWWRTDEHRGACSSNQFGVMPTTPVRFRCVGAITPKYPKRYRIELAQALDWLPELTPRELKGLGASLVEAIAAKLGVDVAPFNCDVMDLELSIEDET